MWSGNADSFIRSLASLPNPTLSTAGHGRQALFATDPSRQSCTEPRAHYYRRPSWTAHYLSIWIGSPLHHNVPETREANGQKSWSCATGSKITRSLHTD